MFSSYTYKKLFNARGFGYIIRLKKEREPGGVRFNKIEGYILYESQKETPDEKYKGKGWRDISVDGIGHGDGVASNSLWREPGPVF